MYAASPGRGQAPPPACEDPCVHRAPLVQLPPELVPPGVKAEGGGYARFVLGIDGGATKTLAALLDLELGTLHLGQGGPSNEDAVGTRSAVQALLEAADEAVGKAGIDGELLDAEVIALAGTDTDAVARWLLTQTSARDLEITSRGLEEAFLALTGDPTAGPGGGSQAAT